MRTTVINIKTDPKVKAGAKKVASQLGFSLSSLINGYLKQLIKTKTVYFRLSEEQPSEYLIQALRESEEDRRAGRYKSFAAADEALGYIDKIIDEHKKS